MENQLPNAIFYFRDAEGKLGMYWVLPNELPPVHEAANVVAT
jgi:hypothetical protein